MKIQSAKAGIGTGRAGLQAASGLFSSAGLFDKGVKSFNPLDLDPYLLFDAQTSMIGTLENPTLDLDPSKQDTLDVITATRAGVATYTDFNGNIATAPANTVRVDQTQGAELTPTVYQRVKYTDFSQLWSGGNGTVTDGQGFSGNNSKIITGTSPSGFIDTSVATEDGVTYTGSIYIRRLSGTGGLEFTAYSSASSDVTPLITDTVGTDFVRVSFQFLGKSGGGNVFFGIKIQQSGDSVEIAMPQVEEGTTPTTFVANTTGSPKFTGISATYGPRVPMVLIEPSAENLVTYSEDFSDSSWTKTAATMEGGHTAPDGTASAYKLIEDTTDSVHRTFQTATASVSPSASISVFVKYSGRRYVLIRFADQSVGRWYDLLSGTLGGTYLGTPNDSSIELIGNDWYRITLSHTSNAQARCEFWVSDTESINSYTGDGTSGVYIWGAQLETGSVATSYIPTSGGDAAARTRAADDLSIDPDSTNHITNTDFSTWATQNITVSSGGGFSGYSSSIITATGTGNKFFTATLSGITAGQTHTGSIYIRRTNGSGRVDFVHPNSTSGSDSSNRTITTDWTRVTCQFNGSTSSGVVTQFQIRMFTAGDSLEIAMPQVELGSSPTGFIPTSGAAASRTTFSDFYNQSEGTFYVEFEPRELSTSITNTVLELSNGTGAERILSIVYSSYHAYFVDGGVVQANPDGGTYTAGALNRLAFSFKANNIQVSVGGGSVVTDTSASIPTVDRLIIGNQSVVNTRQLNGHIKRLIYWPYHSDSL